jgi:hypothetical protein
MWQISPWTNRRPVQASSLVQLCLSNCQVLWQSLNAIAIWILNAPPSAVAGPRTRDTKERDRGFAWVGTSAAPQSLDTHQGALFFFFFCGLVANDLGTGNSRATPS